MITIDFITALFCQVDEQMRTMPKHPEARLWPSEVVTLAAIPANSLVAPLFIYTKHTLGG